MRSRKRMIILLILVTFLFAGTLSIIRHFNERAIFYGDHRVTPGEKEFMGFSKIEVRKKSYLANEPVLLTFYYGHKYDALSFEEAVLNHHVVVYVAESLQTSYHQPQNYQEIERISFEGNSFMNGVYAIENTSLGLLRKIKYRQSFDLDLDFKTFGIDAGVLVIDIRCTFLMDQGEGLEEATTVERSYVYFKVENDKVNFSWRSFQ